MAVFQADTSYQPVAPRTDTNPFLNALRLRQEQEAQLARQLLQQRRFEEDQRAARVAEEQSRGYLDVARSNIQRQKKADEVAEQERKTEAYDKAKKLHMSGDFEGAAEVMKQAGYSRQAPGQYRAPEMAIGPGGQTTITGELQRTGDVAPGPRETYVGSAGKVTFDRELIRNRMTEDEKREMDAKLRRFDEQLPAFKALSGFDKFVPLVRAQLASDPTMTVGKAIDDAKEMWKADEAQKGKTKRMGTPGERRLAGGGAVTSEWTGKPAQPIERKEDDFTGRMFLDHQVMDRSGGMSKEGARTIMQEMAASGIPGFNWAMKAAEAVALKNTLRERLSPSDQLAFTAFLDFLNNHLRGDSGSAIPAYEIQQRMEQLMPMVGDTAETIMFKRDARKQLIRGSAGKGYRPSYWDAQLDSGNPIIKADRAGNRGAKEGAQRIKNLGPTNNENDILNRAGEGF